MSTEIRNDSKWRRERRQNTERPTPKPTDNGCHCHNGPRVVATWSRPHSTLSVALEHFGYCPVPTINPRPRPVQPQRGADTAVSDQPDLEPAGRTETTTRRYDKDGVLIEETVTTTARHEKPADDLPMGLYL